MIDGIAELKAAAAEKKREKEEAERKKAEEEISRVTLHVKMIEGIDDIEYKFEENHKITSDKEVDQYIFNKAITIDKMIKRDRVEQGKVFTEVYDTLSKDSWNGKYEEWLRIYGFNKKTAYSHRNRYRLYSYMTSKEGKSNVASMSQKLIDSILNHKELNTLIEMLDEKLDKESISAILMPPEKETIKTSFGDIRISVNKNCESFKKYSRSLREDVMKSLKEGVEIDEEELKKDLQEEIDMLLDIIDKLSKGK